MNQTYCERKCYNSEGIPNLYGIAHFRDLEDQKIQVGRDLKMGRFLLH